MQISSKLKADVKTRHAWKKTNARLTLPYLPILNRRRLPSRNSHIVEGEATRKDQKLGGACSRENWKSNL